MPVFLGLLRTIVPASFNAIIVAILDVPPSLPLLVQIVSANFFESVLRGTISIVFQEWNAFPHHTVVESVMLAPREVPGKSEDGTRVLALRHVGLGPKLDVFPSKRSGGQQRLMAIDYALTMSTEYILLDEVTSALRPMLFRDLLDTRRMLLRA